MAPPDRNARDADGLSSSEDETTYVFYSERPEWRDVVPVPQAEPINPVVSIDYRPDYVDAMDYFRAVHASGEVSNRALQLTADAIQMNGANYTV
jgi:protein farnesyltransferase/geranylgeranyltransferase type-1 subunit alpha